LSTAVQWKKPRTSIPRAMASLGEADEVEAGQVRPLGWLRLSSATG
jgi:hypothetical protein